MCAYATYARTLPLGASFGQIAEVYEGLDVTEQRSLASSPAAEAAFAPVTPAALASATHGDVVGPDSGPNYNPKTDVYAFVDRLDGSLAAKYYYRLITVDQAGLASELGSASPSVEVPAILRPAVPVLLSISAKTAAATLVDDASQLLASMTAQESYVTVLDWRQPGLMAANWRVDARHAVDSGVPLETLVVEKPSIELALPVPGLWSVGVVATSSSGVCSGRMDVLVKVPDFSRPAAVVWKILPKVGDVGQVWIGSHASMVYVEGKKGGVVVPVLGPLMPESGGRTLSVDADAIASGVRVYAVNMAGNLWDSGWC